MSKNPIRLICICGCEFIPETGKYNRAIKMGRQIFCSWKCSGIGRRKNIPVDEKKRLKAEYDREYRKKNREYIKERKTKYNESEAGRAMQKRNRDKFKKFHLEYCRTTEYRAWKKKYDHKFGSQKVYGDFWENVNPLMELRQAIDKLSADIDNGTINKSQKRKRQCKTTKPNSLPRI